MKLVFDEIETPVGTMLLVAGESGVCALEFDFDVEQGRRRLEKRFGRVELRRQADPCGYSGRLRAYFAGDLRALDEIAADTGGTDFQHRVWTELRKIPVGRTCSYADLARAVGRPSATRAVGAANGRNPVSVIVPCHRVIGADGSLTGYGGGLERKRWLLSHEGVAVPPEG
jgi:methylated-DNA-[protein]-cysteine S-methyltransferase